MVGLRGGHAAMLRMFMLEAQKPPSSRPTNPEVLNPAFHGSDSDFKGGHGDGGDGRRDSDQSQCKGKYRQMHVRVSTDNGGSNRNRESSAVSFSRFGGRKRGIQRRLRKCVRRLNRVYATTSNKKKRPNFCEFSLEVLRGPRRKTSGQVPPNNGGISSRCLATSGLNRTPCSVRVLPKRETPQLRGAFPFS
jgi:hypothetical protein